ncbi:MAG: ATP-dependent helicase [Candidatus Lokiarchaeota archaeon]|nr:ATP-dependent helicase [Candidatus Lokiarchaeota archaeon]
MSDKKENSEEEFIFEIYDEDYANALEEEVTEVIEEYNEINFDKDLNDEQLKIIENIKGPMLVIAGAGSGKTRTITYAVAKLLLSRVKPSEIMLVTFTNKAANEMIKRVETLLGKRPKGIWAGTFHSIANRFIRIYAKTLGLKANYTIMDETDAKALMKLSIEKANVKEIEERFPNSRMSKAILSYSINCNKSIKDVLLWKYSQFDSEDIIKKLELVYKIYREKKAQDNLVDFDDLLIYWNQLLDERSVAQLIARNIKHVLVDEYQDTNHIQDEIIYKIAKQNPDHNVIAVGDDAQSIYAFRGANFQNILNFEKKYKNCKRYTITYNYRSVPQILGLANNSIQHNVKQFKKDMQATRPSGILPYQVNVGDDKEQAYFIANRILKLRSEGYKLEDMSVLVRAGFHSLRIELELKAKNIPYEVRAGVAFFEKAHIKDIIAHLRIIENPHDEISWSRIFTIIQGIGSSSGTKIFEEISKVENPIDLLINKMFYAEKLKGSRISKEGIKNIISHTKKLVGFNPEDEPSDTIKKLTSVLEDHIKSRYDNWQDRMDDLNQLSIYASNFPTIRKLLENLSLNLSNLESKTVLTGSQQEEEKPMILSTIHRAKGLEWRVVFIPMLCEDSFPSSRVKGDPEGLEEERRVFYVAVTRTKDQLYLISPSLVQSSRGYQTMRNSPFISELNPKVYKKSSVQIRSKAKVTRKGLNKPHKSLFQTADELLKEDK